MFVTSEFESSYGGLIGFEPQQDSEFLDIGICGSRTGSRGSYDPGILERKSRTGDFAYIFLRPLFTGGCK
jgi:hypothetical protein